MKILHVIRGLANSSGTTHIVGPLAEEQARLGHKVSLYYVDKPPFEAVVPRAELVHSKCFPVTALRGNPGVSIPFAQALSRDIGSFDVVHIHAVWNFPSFFAMRLAARKRTPYIVAPQGSLEPWALKAGSAVRRAYVDRIEAPLIRSATRMQALTVAEAQQFAQFGYDGPVSIIPNGVSPDWLEQRRTHLGQQLGLPTGTRTLLFLSRIHPKKGLDRLLQGYARFVSDFPRTALVIAGDDAGSGYGQEMRALAGQLGITDKCHFLGEIAGERKKALLSGADAFALTSHSEGLPVAVVEAMACGTPVIVTPGCNLPEVAEFATGLITHIAPEAIAADLHRMFSLDASSRQTMGANGHRLVASRFTWPILARDSVGAYAQMRAQHQVRATV